jgi:hypothetical protein
MGTKELEKKALVRKSLERPAYGIPSCRAGERLLASSPQLSREKNT